jgi:hypothetical protein
MFPITPYRPYSFLILSFVSLKKKEGTGGKGKGTEGRRKEKKEERNYFESH